MDKTKLALSIAEVLPEDGSIRDELGALGMVVVGVISTADQEQRTEIVEKFCETLRISMASQLN